MRRKTLQKIVVQIAFTACLSAFLLISGNARPGGVYRGKSLGNTLSPVTPGPPVVTLGTTDIKLRFPNGKGKIRGTLFTSRPPLSGPFDIPISGRVRKTVSRMGGKKHIVSGNWSWKFGTAGATSDNASGPFQIIIKKIGNKYKFAPPERVKATAGGAMPYIFRSKVRVKK